MTLVQRLLATRAVWTLSGLFYRTAVVATKGRFLAPEPYLDNCRRDMESLREFIPQGPTRILEFGCGIGGNLLSTSGWFAEGVGVDVNRGFLRIANRLARRFKVQNVRFVRFDGYTIPSGVGRFDGAFSLNVFERLPHELVCGYLQQISERVKPRGILVLSFINERARSTEFTRRLGNDSYCFWTEVEETELVQRAAPNAKILKRIRSGLADVMVLENGGTGDPSSVRK